MPKTDQQKAADERRINNYRKQLYQVWPEIPNPYAPRMKVTPLALEGVKLISVDRYEDSRGCFSDHWHIEKFKEITDGLEFKQDSYVTSYPKVVRGLHYQVGEKAQGKLVRCIHGRIQDVIVDLRKSSKTFGQWINVYLSGDHHEMVWIPPGFAHGYSTLDNDADVLYKMTEVHSPDHERTLLWNDPDLGIKWDAPKKPILSFKDSEGTPLKECDLFD